MKVKTTMKRLRDADPQWISLVRRGANQIPFRIKKAGEEMELDLSAPLRIFKGEKKKKSAVVCSLVVRKDKNKNFEEVKEKIKKAGYSVDNETEVQPGIVKFAQSDEADDGATAIRMSEELVVMVKSFEPWNMATKSFADRIGLDGYHASLYTACDALRSCFSDCVWNADTHADMIAGVEAALSDFTEYVKGIAAAIPPAAYKASDGMTTVQMSAPEPEKKEEEKAVEEPPAVEPAKTEETAVSTDTEKKVETTEAKETTKKEEATPETTTETTPPAQPSLADVLAAINSLSEKVGGVEKIQLEQAEKLTSLDGQVKESIKKSADIEGKISGVVAAPPIDADATPAPKKTTKKAADDLNAPDIGDGFWDSAYRR